MKRDNSVYIETSVVSRLTGRRTRDITVAVQQISTDEWWEVQRPYFELYTSELTIEEAGGADPLDAVWQLETLEGLTVLHNTDAVIALADELVHRRAIPSEARNAATHVAAATVHEIVYLMTWNFRHIFNSIAMRLIGEVCQRQSYRSPVICSPNELMHVLTMHNEVTEEPWESKETVARKHDIDARKPGEHFRSHMSANRTYAIPGHTFKDLAEVRAYIKEKRKLLESNIRSST